MKSEHVAIATKQFVSLTPKGQALGQLLADGMSWDEAEDLVNCEFDREESPAPDRQLQLEAH